MRQICLCFEFHCPVVLRRYRFFEINNSHYYYDDQQTAELTEKLVRQKFLPLVDLLTTLSLKYAQRFRFGISTSGITLKLLQHYQPYFLNIWKELGKLGGMEFLGDTFSHTLVPFFHPESLPQQLELHKNLVEEVFGEPPRIFYQPFPFVSGNAEATARLLSPGGIIAARPFAGNGKNGLEDHSAKQDKKLAVVDQQLSRKLLEIHQKEAASSGSVVARHFLTRLEGTTNAAAPRVLFFNPVAANGAFSVRRGVFWEALIRSWLAREECRLVTPSEIFSNSPGEETPEISASFNRNPGMKNFWFQNHLQQEALGELLKIDRMMPDPDSRMAGEDWYFIQDMDHLFFMNSQFFSPLFAGKHFNPYTSPYEAFINYMNVLEDYSDKLVKEKPEFRG